MNNVAFIVDGFTEKLILQRLCPGKPIRRTDLNGKDVQISAIAKKVASIIRVLGDRYNLIVIIVDKEQRNISHTCMLSSLEEHLKNEEGIKSSIIIGIPDIMIENWIIADWDKLDTKEQRPPDTDGLNGSSVLKKIKKSYNKTTDGVNYFLKADPKIIYHNSPSYKAFIDSLSEKLSCHYINKIGNQ